MSNLFKLSVSKSSTFQSCKAKYKFVYIQKLPRKEYTYHLFGRFVHRILELFHLLYINGSDLSYQAGMSQAFNEAMLEFKGKITKTAKEEAFDILNKYIKTLDKNYNIVSSVQNVEENFNLSINDNLILTGMIDRVQLDSDGTYHVLDYKTSKSKIYLKEDTLQLLTYAYVLYKKYPDLKKVRVSYIMLKHNCEFLTKEFSLEEILTIKNIYEKFADNINKEVEFQPNPTKLCEYCEFSSICESGKEFINKLYKIGKTKW